MRRHAALLAGLLPAAIAACAGPRAGGTYQTSVSYDRLYAASLAAVPAVGFSVSSSNKADGLIVAQQGVVMGKGSSVGLNIGVFNSGNVRSLQVNFQAPPGTLPLGDFDRALADYISMVQSRVPDLRQQP